jgi:hypothetical protein
MCDIANHCLPTVGNTNVLHHMWAGRAVPLQGFHLSGKGSRELIERALTTILLNDVLGNSEAMPGCHSREVDNGHLRWHASPQFRSLASHF